jgi:hypothetical protein
MGQGVLGLAYLAALQCMPVTCTRQNHMLDNLDKPSPVSPSCNPEQVARGPLGTWSGTWTSERSSVEQAFVRMHWNCIRLNTCASDVLKAFQVMNMAELQAVETRLKDVS